MHTERKTRIFRAGGNQALEIPADLELPGKVATIRKEGRALIVEPTSEKTGLLALLATLEALPDEFPELDDPPPRDEPVF